MTPTATTESQTTTPRSNYAIVRHVDTNALYIAHGGDEYTNLQTGVRGKIKPSTAKKWFVINLSATQILSDYPLVEEMITRLKLVCEK